MKNRVSSTIGAACVPATIILAAAAFIAPAGAESLKLEMLPGEYWWGGLSSVEHQTPYDATSVATHDLQGDAVGLPVCQRGFCGLRLALPKVASKTGEPIAKPMAMAFPEGGYETIKDQFVLGNDIIVAPVVEKGVRSRTVVLPKGEWKAEDGSIHIGGASVKIEVLLQRLPYFVKQ